MTPKGWFPDQWLQVWHALTPFARPHKEYFFRGAVAAILVVLLRLSLPWPFRHVLRPLLSGEGLPAESQMDWPLVGVDPLTAMGGLFFLLLVALGYADHLERMNFARFAIEWVKDLRRDAMRVLFREGTVGQSFDAGDLVARLVGDTARVKAGLHGFLVHAATNGLMFAGVILILIWMDPVLGGVFTLAGLAAAAVTAFGFLGIHGKAIKQRKKEGKLASIILASLEDFSERRFVKVNRSSSRHEVSTVRLQGITTLRAHIVLGVAVMAGLWVGANAISDGRITGGDLFVLFAYVLMLRAPMIQLARQGARTGKIIAAAERLSRLLRTGRRAQEGDSVPLPLRDRLKLAHVRVSGRKVRPNVRLRRLGPIDLEIPAGQRVAVVGASGSGKSTLLELIAGYQKPKRGKVLWDGSLLAQFSAVDVSTEIAYLAQDPRWRRCKLGRYLGLPEAIASGKSMELMEASGARAVIDRLPLGLESKVSSADFSFRQRKAIGLARVLLSSASLWLLDEPLSMPFDWEAEKLLRLILSAAGQRTVMITFNHPSGVELFNRVVELREGRIDFDGGPEEWLEKKKNNRAEACVALADKGATVHFDGAHFKSYEGGSL